MHCHHERFNGDGFPRGLKGREIPLAIRSSAQGEDLPGKSCAGMYTTLLGVKGDSLSNAYKEVIASKYATRAIMYRLKYGIGDEDVAMCVGCMPLINAKCGGVAYSRNPLDVDDRRVMIHSVFGLPGPVADGSAASDLLVASRGKHGEIVESEIAKKTDRVRKTIQMAKPTGVILRMACETAGAKWCIPIQQSTGETG